MQFDPNKFQPIEQEVEERADSLVDKLRASPYTALILVAVAIGALVLILSLA